MKLIDAVAKTINYFGVELKVHRNHKYVATDETGEVYSYEEEPKRLSNVWYGGGSLEHLADVDLEGLDWRESLTEIKE